MMPFVTSPAKDKFVLPGMHQHSTAAPFDHITHGQLVQQVTPEDPGTQESAHHGVPACCWALGEDG